MNVAILDIGTNSIHMLIIRVDADLRFHVIDKAKVLVHLGRSTFSKGYIDEETMERALEVLANFRRIADRRGVERFVAVATSAVREASNGGAFLQEVQERTGIRARVISGAEEGRLVFRAVQQEIGQQERPFAVVDIGGGSVEVALGTSERMDWVVSLKAGVRRLEATLGTDAAPSGPASLKRAVERELGPVLERAKAQKVGRCIVTAGSAGSVLRILQSTKRVPGEVDRLPAKALAQLEAELEALTRPQRLAIPGMDPERVDLVLPAVTLLRCLAEGLGIPELHVSSNGLREGLAIEHLDRFGGEMLWEMTEPNRRRRTVLSTAQRYAYDAAHAHHVARLAVAFFDATRRLHRLSEKAREWLEYAALLHDVGYVVEEKAHHKHSEYLILHGLNGGFTIRERRLIAAIARYHRKKAPRIGHKNWSSLTLRDRELVRRAASILRIADGLDRAHARNVASVAVKADAHRLLVRLGARDDASLERWAAKKKADLFEATFRRTVDIELQAEAPPAKGKG